jgi:Ca-activated chloride channel family protein
LVSTSGDGLPLRTVRLTSDVAGSIARTVVYQHFANDDASPLELEDLLPLPADGAISSYEFEAGERRTVGRVERRDEARAEYESPRLAGRTAALVEQQRLR